METNIALPIYNISAVLKVTGLSADVLRAWEKRYGLPDPQRSPGGHRLYSEYDIYLIKWLQAKMEEGLSISLAVKLWFELLHSGTHPLKGFLPTFRSEAGSGTSASGQVDQFRSTWINACLDFDTTRGETILSQAFTLFPMDEVIQRVLQKGMADIGQLWFENKATPQQEHFACAQAERKLNTLISGLPNPVRNENILIGCPAGETHTFPVLLLTLMLRRMGFNIIYLGANIPMDQMKATLSRVNIQLVILAAQRLVTAASLYQSAQIIRNLGIPFAFGGLVFNQQPGLVSVIPGRFLGEDLPGAPSAIEKLMATHPQLMEIKAEESHLSGLLEQFKIKRSLIESKLSRYLSGIGMKWDQIMEVNIHLSDAIQAAIVLGSLDYLQVDLNWAHEMSENRFFNRKQFQDYLSAAALIISRETGINDNAVSTWLIEYNNLHLTQ